jgi:uncharacterized protein YaeQ
MVLVAHLAMVLVQASNAMMQRIVATEQWREEAMNIIRDLSNEPDNPIWQAVLDRFYPLPKTEG